jgi:hypothetical protein
MTPEERHRGAFEEFDERLSDGLPVEEAVRIAAENNELRPENFRSFAEERLGDLEKYREKKMFRAERARLVEITRDEITKCLRREEAYKSVGGLFARADEAIAESVGKRVGRSLTANETEMIEDAWDAAFYAGPGGLRGAMKRVRDWRRSQS